MQRDPFLPDPLAAYFEASERYHEAVDDLTKLVGRDHRKFVDASLRVRRLWEEVQAARAVLVQHKLLRTPQVEGLERGADRWSDDIRSLASAAADGGAGPVDSSRQPGETSTAPLG